MQTKEIDISISIVTYNSQIIVLDNLIQSIRRSSLNLDIYIIDNSKQRLPEAKIDIWGAKYIRPKKNIGYGRANNLAIREMLKGNPSKYHLVVNPDVMIINGTLDKLFDYMNAHAEIGMVMPKVVYPNDEIQYLCKLLPTPKDLIIRRFFSSKKDYQALNKRYELRHMDYDKPFFSPCLSGCFMFIRTSIFEQIGLFDERYFLYMEDIDFCRRIKSRFELLYYPEGKIIHEHRKESYKSFKVLFYHIVSAIKYFNKWGWFKDEERDAINEEFLMKNR